MALAAMRNGKPGRHLAPVGSEDGDEEPQVSLAEKLAAAQAAVAEPQRRVSELESALTAAVEASDFARAAEIQEQLPAAREALALAGVEVRVITEAQAALSAAADAGRRKIAEARQREEAQRLLEDGMAAEQMALDQVDEALQLMRGHLAAAKGALQKAATVEAGVLQAQRQQIEARRLLREWPEHHPGPAPTGSARCQALADTTPVVRELGLWRP